MPCGASGKLLELPHERPLEVPSLLVQLDDAEIVIEVSDEEPSSLFVSSLAKGPDGSPLPVPIELTAEAGGWKLGRPAAEESPASTDFSRQRVRVSLVLTTEQMLKIIGQNLEIGAQNAVVPAGRSTVREEDDDDDDEDEERNEEENQDEGAGGNSPVKVAPAAEAKAQHSYSFQLKKSQLNVVALEGLDVEADDSWVRFDRTSGALQLTVNNGSLTV